MITLPTEKVKASVHNPRFLILFGKPKSGKTSCVAALPDSLLIDLEGGSQYMDAVAIQARTVQDLSQIAVLLREKKEASGQMPYKRIIIDNATRLEEITLSIALSMYQKTPMGKSYNGDVRMLPNGGGWFYVREAVKKTLEMFQGLCDEFLLVGHTKDKMINKEGKELSEMQLDLAGRLSDIICGLADAVGYVYREKKQTIVSFQGGENLVVEARQPHLKGKKIVLAESDDDNNLTVYWDRIYLPN